MNKLHKFDGYEDYIKLVLISQDSNGLWSSGYNSYLVQNSQELDMLHTSVAMLNLLDYQIWKTAQQLKNADPVHSPGPGPNPSPDMSKMLDSKKIGSISKQDNSIKEIDVVVENFENKYRIKKIKKEVSKYNRKI